MAEIAGGLTLARTRTRNNPTQTSMFDQSVTNVYHVVKRVLAREPGFTVALSDGAFFCQHLRVEPGSDPDLAALAEHLTAQNISSITFKSDIEERDIALFLSGLAGSSDLCHTPLPADSVVLNAPNAPNGLKMPGVRQSPEMIIKAIRGLIEIVKRRGTFSDAKAPFVKLVSDIEGASSSDWHSYREAMASVVEFLPREKRVALLQDLEMQPFALMLLSRLGDDTLIELITNWERQSRTGHIVKTLAIVDKEKLYGIVRSLKNRQVRIYQYLLANGVDLLIDDAVAPTIAEDDLNGVFQHYHEMLAAEDPFQRCRALKSLTNFCARLARDAKHGMVDTTVMRICPALEQESSETAINQVVDDIADLYRTLRDCEQNGPCERIIESLGNILGRAETPVPLKKRVIEVLVATRHPSVLHILLSLLWESGLYPDVRAAIIGFGGSAVKEAVQLLRYAEEFSLRMKLIDVLKHMGEQGIEVLRDNLNAREWFLRRNIVRILGEIDEPAAHPHLDAMLSDEDHRVRLEVVRAYNRLNDKAGLLMSLNDKFSEVKAEALRGLRRMIDGGEFINLLPQLGASGDEVYIELMKIIDDKRIAGAMHWIGDLLKRLEWRNDRIAEEIKALGVTTLARLGGDEAKAILSGLGQLKDKYVADLASNALRRMG
ncbi:HEAT repeat domain-containing protein [candidate division WOR-3 bacterium]|nr:HEAT repeat domain-containing protein [candidate division WOR-3 bacterium]